MIPLHRVTDVSFMSMCTQGPFHVILHKLSEDVMLRHVQPESGRRIHTLEKYVRDHPEVVLVEHPRDIEKIVSR